MPNQIFNKIKAEFENKNKALLKRLAKDLFNEILISRYLYDNTYFHPLGFIYSRLYEFPNKETIRLHIWDKQKYFKEPLMEIHNHFYTVNSFIATGRIKNIIYKSLEYYSPNYSIYKGSYNLKGDRFLEKTKDKLYVEKVSEQVFTKDDIYHITTEDLHSSYVEMEEFTCTIVFTQAPGKPTPLVLGPLDGEYQYFYNTQQTDNILVDYLMNKLVDIY